MSQSDTPRTDAMRTVQWGKDCAEVQKLERENAELQQSAGFWKAETIALNTQVIELRVALEEERGIEGRCQRGHHKKFTYQLDGKNGCMVCERDAERKAQEEATVMWACGECGSVEGFETIKGYAGYCDVRCNNCGSLHTSEVSDITHELANQVDTFRARAKALEDRVRELEGK